MWAADLSPRTTAILFVACVNRLTPRALAVGRSLGADRFEAVTVACDPTVLTKLRRRWAQLETGVPLVVVPSPMGEVLRPAMEYVRALGPGPDHTVVALIPELALERWYERFLHNQTGTRLKAALLQIPGVVVANVRVRPGE